VTYKKSELPEVIQQIDLDHIVLETDAPYLPPVPYRGKRNESSYIPLIAEKLTEIYNCSLSEIAEKTSQNAIHLFQLEKFGVK
jgi:TatD DNase family protein